MNNIQVYSRNTLLHRLGLPTGTKSVIFFISLMLITLPMAHVYNTLAVILFVLFTVLSYQRASMKIHLTAALWLPIILFVLMTASVAWSVDTVVSFKALSKEAPLLFIPLAFGIMRSLRYKHINDILRYYSSAMCLLAIYITLRAVFRFFSGEGMHVFFLNGLATLSISLYLSVFLSLAMFYFLGKKNNTYWGKVAMYFLFFVIILLSKKIIIITDAVVVIVYYLFFSKDDRANRVYSILLFTILASALAYYGNVSEIMERENERRTGAPATEMVHNVTLQEAWTKESFSPGDYLNGYAFRLYQLRTAKEMLSGSSRMLSGYGINASSVEVKKRGEARGLTYTGWADQPYNTLNFHNQYIEAFSDLGIGGCLLIIAMVVYSLYNAVRRRYFIHIAFSVLMISLFLTESFLWRQKGLVFFTVFYCLFNTPGIFVKQNNV